MDIHFVCPYFKVYFCLVVYVFKSPSLCVMCIQVREQLEGVCLLFLSCRLQGLNVVANTFAP